MGVDCSPSLLSEMDVQVGETHVYIADVFAWLTFKISSTFLSKSKKRTIVKTAVGSGSERLIRSFYFVVFFLNTFVLIAKNLLIFLLF